MLALGVVGRPSVGVANKQHPPHCLGVGVLWGSTARGRQGKGGGGAHVRIAGDGALAGCCSPAPPPPPPLLPWVAGLHNKKRTIMFFSGCCRCPGTVVSKP